MIRRGPVARAALALALALLALRGPATAAVAGGDAPGAGPAGMVWIPAGSYVPLFRRPVRDPATGVERREARPVAVAGFWLDRYPVTNAEYLEFVRAHPEWRRSRVSRLYADEAYLRRWRGDLDYGDASLARGPVTGVSWFAARAYCAARGRQLPSVDQWEYAAAADEHRADATRDPAFQRRLREWYSRPTPARLPEVGSTFRNVYGVWDLHGLAWEWTRDYSSALVTGESRADASLERGLYCGSGAANAADFRDYAAFMRFGFRSSLSARYCVSNLGFRAALEPSVVAGAR